MRLSRKYLIVGASILALGAGGAGVALATGDDGDEQATGAGAERAKRVAVELVGGGRAIEVEREDEGGAAWEVEVERAGGGTIDVRLNGGYNRVAEEDEQEDDDSSRDSD